MFESNRLQKAISMHVIVTTKTIGLFFRIALVFFFLVGTLATKPASDISSNVMKKSSGKSVSPEQMLTPDGTLNLNQDFSGTFDLEGWDVKMDTQRGPVFTRADYVPIPAF